MGDFEDAGGARNRDARRRPRRKPKDVVEGRLRAHDPFELIRWLALSQPDPRKALSELVQNSLDAGARSIRCTEDHDDSRLPSAARDDFSVAIAGTGRGPS